MKKLLALVMALMLVMSAAYAIEWNLEGTIFPLEEPETFTIMTFGYVYDDIAKIESNPDWQDLQEQTNVHIVFDIAGTSVSDESRDIMQTRLVSQDYDEAIWGFYYKTLTRADITDMGNAGLAYDVTDFMSDPAIMPNFVENAPEDIVRGTKDSNGRIYFFPSITQVNKYTAGEAMMQVNVAWMNAWDEARGYEANYAPANKEEFEDMLQYFLDNDMNGNGDTTDEIPYMIAQQTINGNATIEHALGMWGISTKDSGADMNLSIDENQQVYYVHTTDAYRAGITVLADWYAKGYIYQDCFVANTEDITAIVGDAANRFGVVNMCYNTEGFEPVVPPTIDENYPACFFMHPTARTALDNPDIVITNKCHNPEVLASFYDLLYNFDNSMIWRYGSMAFEEGSVAYQNPDKYVTITKGEDGKYVYSIPQVESYDAGIEVGPLNYVLPRIDILTNETLDKYVDLDTYIADVPNARGYKLYDENNLWPSFDRIWGRYSLLEEDADDYAFYYTDEVATLAEYRAKFVTGELEVNDENWAAFQAQLESNGIVEMREMAQRAYDDFLSR
ncbi:MAG: hypothetical protein MJ099_00505 [Clostridia bacterium]|nr:hypothetical protein [Clostridia bacterium]